MPEPTRYSRAVEETGVPRSPFMMALASSELMNQSMKAAHSSLYWEVSATEKNMPGFIHKPLTPPSTVGGVAIFRLGLTLAIRLVKLFQLKWNPHSSVAMGPASMPKVTSCSYSSGSAAPPLSIISFHMVK